MIKPLTQEIIEATRKEARTSPRKRAIYKFHEPLEHTQRMINVLLKGTYVQPHQHSNPPKVEHFTVLEGEIACVEFDLNGTIITVYRMRSNGPVYGVDIAAGTIHCLVCVSEEAVLHEIIDGVFDPLTHKQFADFAPSEGSIEATNWLMELEQSIRSISRVR